MSQVRPPGMLVQAYLSNKSYVTDKSDVTDKSCVRVQVRKRWV